MFAPGTQAIRWNDPHTWPWIVYVWLAFLVAGWVPGLWRRWRNQSAKSWLPVSATIDSTHVDATPHRFQLSRRSEQVRAEINYSYPFGGTHYTGQYSRMFYSEAEALESIRDLSGKSITAQVMPANPARSLVLDSEINNLIKARPPRSFDQVKFQNLNDLTQYWFTPFL
jgi:Protein of unknown function (DUF3592)